MEMESLDCLYSRAVTAQRLFVEGFHVLHALHSKATISFRFASCQIDGSFIYELVNKQTSFKLQTR